MVIYVITIYTKNSHITVTKQLQWKE